MLLYNKDGIYKMAELNFGNIFLDTAKNVPILGQGVSGIEGMYNVSQEKPNYTIMDLITGYYKGMYEGSPPVQGFNALNEPIGNKTDQQEAWAKIVNESGRSYKDNILPELDRIKQAAIDSARDSFQTPSTPKPPSINQQLENILATIGGQSEQQIALQAAQQYENMVNELNKNMADNTAAIVNKYAPKIKKGLTKAEKAALDAEINANKRRYESALKDAEGAYNFANRSIRQIGEQSAALNAALIPAAQQQLSDAVGGSARIAAESGLAGVGGGVASAGMSDAAKAAAMNARQAIGSILGTEGAGIESSPAMAALLEGAPPLQFFDQTIDPRQFGALQSGRFGTDIASQALAAGQASDVTNIARLAADREAGMRERAFAASMAKQQEQLDEFNRFAMQSELNTVAQMNANRLSAAEAVSNAYAKNPMTPAEIAKQQVAINEAGILLQQKYNPTVSEDPTIGEAYETGLTSPIANDLSSRISSISDENGNIVLSVDPVNPKNNVLVPAASLQDFVYTTVGRLSNVPEGQRKTNLNSELIALRKEDINTYNALAIALTGKPSSTVAAVTAEILGQVK